MKKKAYQLYIYGAGACLLIAIGLVFLYCFSSFSKSSKTQYVYIDEDDNIDSVYNKLRPIANNIPFQAFHTFTQHSSYAEHIRTGRYAINPGEALSDLASSEEWIAIACQPHCSFGENHGQVGCRTQQETHAGQCHHQSCPL